MKLNLGYLCVAILVYGPLMKGNGRVVRILLGFMASSSLSKRRSVLTHFFVWKREKEQIVNKQRKGQEGFLQTLSRRATSSNDDTQRRKKMAKLCCICVLREIRNAVEATSLWEIYIYIYTYIYIELQEKCIVFVVGTRYMGCKRKTAKKRKKKKKHCHYSQICSLFTI